MLSSATITYDIADLVGNDFDARRTKVWVSTNIDSGVIADTVGNQIRVGDGLGTIAEDGTGSVSVWVPGTGSNPATWQTYLHFDYAQRRPGGSRVQETFGPFTVTADANLADLIQEQAVPPTYLSEVTAVLDGKVVQAQTAVTAAQAAAAEAVDISNIAVPDGVVGALVAGTGGAGPLTRAALSATYASKGSNIFTGSQQINGYFGVGDDPSKRNPFTSYLSMVPAMPGVTDKVAHALVTRVDGNFTSGEVGSNPQFLWGLNVFTYTGTQPNDGNGLNLTNLIETDIAAPAGSGVIPTAHGLQVEAAFFGPSAGAHVANMTSLRVGSPKRKDGATAGTADFSCGVFVEATTAAQVGATNAFAIYVEGGVSRFLGRVDVLGTVQTTAASMLLITPDAGGARVLIENDTDGGRIIQRLGKSGSYLEIRDSASAALFAIDTTRTRVYGRFDVKDIIRSTGATVLIDTPDVPNATVGTLLGGARLGIQNGADGGNILARLGNSTASFRVTKASDGSILHAMNETQLGFFKSPVNKKTGWVLPTGTSKRSTFDTATVTLAELAGVVKAIVEDLHGTAGYGLLNT